MICDIIENRVNRHMQISSFMYLCSKIQSTERKVMTILLFFLLIFLPQTCDCNMFWIFEGCYVRSTRASGASLNSENIYSEFCIQPSTHQCLLCNIRTVNSNKISLDSSTYFIYVYMYGHECKPGHRSQRGFWMLDPFKVELQSVMSHPMWVLRTESGPCGRAANSLNHSIISQALFLASFYSLIINITTINSTI